MAYKALYRTYRPQSFSDIIGQQTIVRTLQNEIKENKISHAYLFSGPRGTGKTSIARVFAKALNCSNQKDNEPCNECITCKEITEGVSPDVIEIDAASNNGVDEIRAMKDRIGFLPASSKYKIYIIDEVHMLSASAFNALLKTLEEPPKHVIFILATTEPQKVLSTVLSRCQRFDFKSLGIEEIVSVLKGVCEKEKVDYDEEALLHIANACDGGLRDALSFLDQAISFCDEKITDEDAALVTGTVGKAMLFKLANALLDKKLSDALELVTELQNSGKEIGKIVNGLLGFYRDVLMIKNVSNTNSKEFEEFAQKVSFDELYYYIDALSDVQNKIRFSSTSSIYLQVAIIRIVNSSSSDFEYQRRLTELEEKFRSIQTDGIVVDNNNNSSNVEYEELDRKYNNLLAYLSKLDLHKMTERISSLEKTNSSINNNDNTEVIEKLNKTVEEIELIKMKINSLRNQLNNSENNSSQEELINLKLEELLKKNKPSINYSEIETFVKNKVEELFTNIKKEISLLTTEHKETSETDFDEKIKTLDGKIQEVESKMYKVISESLISIKNQNIKKKTRIDEKQISFWGGDFVEVDKINNANAPKKVDFEGLEKIEVKESIADEEVDNENTASSLMNEKPMFEEPNKEEIEEETFINEPIENNIIERTNNEPENLFDEEEIEEKTESINKEVYEEINDSFEGNLFNEDDKDLALSDENESESRSEIIEYPIHERAQSQADAREKEVKEILIKKKEEITNSDSHDFFFENKDVDSSDTVIELEEYKKDDYDNVEMSQNDINDFSSDLDEYERYDIKVLERILNDSRVKEYASEKERIQTLWKNIIDLAPSDKRGVAELLSEGEVKAVGNHEFVLVYSKTKVCNNVMSRKFKKNSLKLLHDLLNDYYNYLAIPSEQWVKKRHEYSSQYLIGTVYPKLTPFDDPSLKVVLTEEDEEEKIEKNVIKIFGEKLKIKRSE